MNIGHSLSKPSGFLGFNLKLCQQSSHMPFYLKKWKILEALRLFREYSSSSTSPGCLDEGSFSTLVTKKHQNCSNMFVRCSMKIRCINKQIWHIKHELYIKPKKLHWPLVSQQIDTYTWNTCIKTLYQLKHNF